jgi:hypothetical protein
MTSQDALLIQGTYNTLYNAITQPDRKFVVTHYFLDEWVPLLGPSLAWLVVALRQRCFWNKRHDWCIVDKATLARDTAMQERTIERCLKKPFSDWFIIDVTHRYRYRTDLGKKVRDKNRYHMLLDEPLSPRHQIGLTRLLRQTIPANMEPLDAALVTLQTLLSLPHLNDKISYKGKFDKNLPRRSVLELVEEVLGIDLLDHADDERLTLIDHSCAQLYNKIVQPNKIYVGWQYFRLNWLEHLGHSLAWMIIYLRRRCYWDEKSGELRDSCRLFKKDLAAAIGQTPRNLANLMDNDYIPLFFTCPTPDDPDYPLEAGDSASRKGPTFYHVRMVDEPLTPADQAYMAAELRGRLQGEFYGTDLENGQLNLFPIIDQASNRQNFAYGQVEENLSGRETKKSRVDHDQSEEKSVREVKKSRSGDGEKEDLSLRRQQKSRLDEAKPENLPVRRQQIPSKEEENLSGRWQKKDRPDPDNAQAEKLSGRPEERNQEQNIQIEIMSDRWGDESPTDDRGGERMSVSQSKKSRLDEREKENLSQPVLDITRKNVATLKDSLILSEPKKQHQQQKPAAALREILEKLEIQEPVRSRLLTDPEITAIKVKAWALYAETQSGLLKPKSYVIKRLLAHDAPPENFIDFARLDEVTWTLFEDIAQALYLGQGVDVEFPPDLIEIFIRWADVYNDMDPTETRYHLAHALAEMAEPKDVAVETASQPDQGGEWARQVWRLTLDQLRLKLTKPVFDTWLRQTSVLTYRQDRLVIGVQNDYAKDWLENRLIEIIERALTNVAGEPIAVEFAVQNQPQRYID